MSDWKTVRLEKIAKIQTGISKSASRKLTDPIELPYLRVANVQDGHLDLSEIKTIKTNKDKIERYLLRKGDVLLTEGGDFDKLGRGTVWAEEIPECLHQNHVFAVRTNPEYLLPEYLSLLTSSDYGKRYFISCSKQSTNLASINSTQLKAFPVLLPSVQTQKLIIHQLDKWDRAIEVTENLITAKQKQFEWLTTNLLNGKTRLQGHTGKWNKTAFQDIFIPSKSVNKDNADYTVLSVTKNGIVNQSEYFNKDVASEDKSKYLIIERGTLVMSGLNFWMGAIDFQNICDVGVVSPAYKSFKIKKGDFNADYLRFFVRSHYMTRILMMCSVQGASVVRRNLDMDMLMNSVIPLPALSEQKSIAHTLNTAQGEIKLLQALAEKYRTQKRGLMQKLLSGQWRLNDKKEAA